MDDLCDDDRLRQLLTQRYGAGATLPDIAALPDALLSHRSVRAFRDAPVPEGTVEAMVAAAQSASTSSNLQTWSVVAVQNAETRHALSKLAGDQQAIREAPLQMVFLADLHRLHGAAARQGGAAAGVDYLELFLVAAIDAALAAQSAALAAETLGLGIVYIGGMRNNPLDVARLLGLPPRCFAVFGMCVGWPDPARPASIKPRLAQSAVLHRETYDAESLEPAVSAYDAVSEQFNREQNMSNRPAWSVHSAKRIAGPESLSGRHTLRDSLARLGFPLK